MGIRLLFASWRSDRLHGLCAAVVRLTVYDAVRHVHPTYRVYNI